MKTRILRANLMCKCLLLALVLIAVALPSCAVDTITSVYKSGGWETTASLSNPNPKAGVVVSVAGTSTYDEDGVVITTAPGTLTLTESPSTLHKKFVSTAAIPTYLQLDTQSGDGSATVDALGKLSFVVNAPNDGLTHVFIFKLKDTRPVIIAWLWRFFGETGPVFAAG